MANNQPRKKAPTTIPTTGLQRAMPFILVALAIFITLCFFTKNTGALGSAIGRILLGSFSIGAYFIPPFLALHAFFYSSDIQRARRLSRAIFTLVVLIFISALTHSIQNFGVDPSFNAGEFYDAGIENVGGGFIGGLISFIFVMLIGQIGLIIVSATVFVLYIVYTFSGKTNPLRKLWDKLLYKFLNFAARKEEQMKERSNLRKARKEEARLNAERERMEREAELYNDEFFDTNNGMKELKINKRGVKETRAETQDPTLQESVYHKSGEEKLSRREKKLLKKMGINPDSEINVQNGLSNSSAANEVFGNKEVTFNTYDDNPENVFSEDFIPLDVEANEKLAAKHSSMAPRTVTEDKADQIPDAPKRTFTEDEITAARRRAEFEYKKNLFKQQKAAASEASNKQSEIIFDDEIVVKPIDAGSEFIPASSPSPAPIIDIPFEDHFEPQYSEPQKDEHLEEKYRRSAGYASVINEFPREEEAKRIERERLLAEQAAREKAMAERKAEEAALAERRRLEEERLAKERELAELRAKEEARAREEAERARREEAARKADDPIARIFEEEVAKTPQTFTFDSEPEIPVNSAGTALEFTTEEKSETQVFNFENAESVSPETPRYNEKIEDIPVIFDTSAEFNRTESNFEEHSPATHESAPKSEPTQSASPYAQLTDMASTVSESISTSDYSAPTTDYSATKEELTFDGAAPAIPDTFSAPANDDKNDVYIPEEDGGSSMFDFEGEAIPESEQNPQINEYRKMFSIFDEDKPSSESHSSPYTDYTPNAIGDVSSGVAALPDYSAPTDTSFTASEYSSSEDILGGYDDEESDNIIEESPFDDDEDLPPFDFTSKAPEAFADEDDLEEEKPKKEKPDYSNYQFPPIDILAKGFDAEDPTIEEEIAETGEKLIDALTQFNVKASIKSVDRGPRITRYEIVPARGVRVNSVINLFDDIALNLAAEGIRMEAPIPGKSAIGVEIPNKHPSNVLLRDLLESEEFQSETSKTFCCVGKDVTGNPIFGDISKMPHVLIAGATGMGKSVCINSILISILYKAKPDEVKLIMIDPKTVEFTMYNGIPHLLVPVVTDVKQAAGALMWAIDEMNRRYELMSKHEVRKLDSYNDLVRENPSLGEPLPKIIIVIDELNDLMMQVRKPVEGLITNITQKARAAGIHMIIGTQRPSVDVITGVIKANVPSRISCKVTSFNDSKTILDQAGAEKLLDKGDMLFAPVGKPKPLRVQGAFVSDSEVEKIMKFLKSNVKGNVYDEEALEEMTRAAQKCSRGKDEDDIDSDSDGEEGSGYLNDKQFLEAVELAVKQGKISTSLIQRKISIGYGKAAKFIDIMEEMGLVSEPNGSKPRDVLVSRDEWHEMLSRRSLDD